MKRQINGHEQHRLVPCPLCGGTRKRLNGPWLRYRRVEIEQSLRTIAQRVGISAAYLSDLERNRREASDEVESRLLFALGVSR